MIRPAPIAPPIAPQPEVAAAFDRGLQRIERRALLVAVAIAALLFLGIAGVRP